MPKVSVVIPVYNMEKYLERCMESVLGQTLADIEILLVDDGGSDASVEMCDEYAKKDPRVRVLHKPNGGLTSAWKAGSEMALGEYIGYVDSDDYIMPDMYERLYEEASAHDADIACCGLRHVYEQGEREEWTEQMEFSRNVFTPSQLIDEMFPILINDGSFFGRRLQPNRVTKLVRRTLVQKNLSLCADRVSIGEDYQFSLCMFLDAAKVVVVRDFFPYIYFMNDSSMTMKYDVTYMDKIRIMKENLSRISDQKGIYDLKPQIINDFLCLTVLYVKGGIYKKKKAPYREHRSDMKRVRERADVEEALRCHTMDRLTPAEKLFLFLLKKRMYLAIFLAVRMY
ncbi:MAG: glycosyltransferase, partial [Lachnospiraceae bacterium]|nr:glycosyltransferase [Lachnospiraceae bacterium]